MVAAEDTPVGGRRTMFLLDAHNLLYRYYHAAPAQLHRGHNVNAVRGLRSLVSRLLSLEPWAVTIVFDGGGSCSGRKDVLPSYKSGRTDMPEDLRYQVELAREHLPKFGASTVRVDGFEADDLIASMALPAREAGHRVYLLTSDKDMLSLVTDALPPIHVYTRIGDGWRVVKEAEVQERLGVPPGKILDMLALCGDKVDGIPGVPGVGDKTAADLILQYGSLKTLFDLLPTLKRQGLKDKLREHRAGIELARRLLEPVPVPIDEIARGTLYAQAPTR